MWHALDKETHRMLRFHCSLQKIHKNGWYSMVVDNKPYFPRENIAYPFFLPSICFVKLIILLATVHSVISLHSKPCNKKTSRHTWTLGKNKWQRESNNVCCVGEKRNAFIWRLWGEKMHQQHTHVSVWLSDTFKKEKQHLSQLHRAWRYGWDRILKC